tara:strand:+ start:2865 stop:3254 length:390 start_codon:yes stop_codon:yes gene_type:complete
MSLKTDGSVFIFSSPSGAGKTTLVKLVSKKKNFITSISHTTRKPRSNEIDGKDYHFVSNHKFQNPKSLEKITRIFFNQRRKKIKKQFFSLFKNDSEIINKLNLDLNLRPQNLTPETYFNLTQELEKLRD